ncbi:MAG: nucleotidyl transferase AbiEii/AbiGii toxin family protein [Candidatus Hydrogenedentota bacterium]
MTSELARRSEELFKEILRRLTELIPASPVVVIGGVALRLHGSNRLTEDLDIAFKDVKTILAVLYDLGFKAVSTAQRDKDGNLTEVKLFPGMATAFQCTLDRKALIFIHDVTQARFDVWLAPTVPYEQLLKNSLPADFDGVPIRVASPEDLIALKRYALEKNPNRSTDLIDIAFLEKKIAKRS